jgi:hypothetical protein
MENNKYARTESTRNMDKKTTPVYDLGSDGYHMFINIGTSINM